MRPGEAVLVTARGQYLMPPVRAVIIGENECGLWWNDDAGSTHLIRTHLGWTRTGAHTSTGADCLTPAV